MEAARPNLGHRALVELFAIEKCYGVITQNVDNLHQESGLPEELIVELHGNATYAKCLNCGCVRICSNGNYGDGSDLIVLDSDCEFCSGRTRCEIDNSLNCMTCMYCGNTYYDNDSGDDSDLIILDSDSDDSDLIVL